MTKEDIPLSKKEPDRVSVIQTTIYKRLRQHQAARQSSLSTRQIRRPVCRYRGSGALGLVSDHRGKRANNAMDPSVRPSVPTLIQERHGDFGLTLAYEKLAELHGYRLSIETLRRWLICTRGERAGTAGYGKENSRRPWPMKKRPIGS